MTPEINEKLKLALFTHTMPLKIRGNYQTSKTARTEICPKLIYTRKMDF